jgi:hypothetical protein
MVLDTGTFFSAVSEPLPENLETIGVLETTARNFQGSPFYRLNGLSVSGQEIPPMDFLVSPTATRLGIDGILGLNFLVQFRHVAFDVDEMRLTLTWR